MGREMKTYVIIYCGGTMASNYIYSIHKTCVCVCVCVCARVRRVSKEEKEEESLL